MKKILLTLGISLLGLIGTFTNANFTTVIETDYEGGYNPNFLNIDGNYSFSVDDLIDYSCDEHDCGLNFVKDGNIICSIVFNDRNAPDIVLNNGNSCVFSAGNYSLVAPDGETFGSIMIEFNTVSGGDVGGGDINEDDNNGSLVEGGTSAFTPIINGLTSTINEFTPYVVYVGLGILGVVVSFFAVKRLLRFVKGSTLSVFSSRRKRK